MYEKDTKILIVGSGVFGLSSAYHLLKNGYKNIEVFDRINHEKTKYNPLNGSDSASGDINKFFRLYYENRTHYSRLANKALDTWEQWNKDIQDLSDEEKSRFLDDDLELIRVSTGMRLNCTPLLSQVELLNLEGFNELGLRDLQYDINSKKDRQRAKLAGLSKKLDVIQDLKDRKKIDVVSGTLDGIGRMLKADKACYYVKILLEKQGVKFHYEDSGDFVSPILEGKTVKGIETKDGNTHYGDLVILSAGSWSASLLPTFHHHVQATLANVVYLEVPKTRQDLINKYSEYPHIQWKTTSSANDRTNNKYNNEGGFAFFPPSKTEGILKVNTRQTKYWNPVKIGDEHISVPKTLGDEKLPRTVIQEAKRIFMALAPDVVQVPGVKLISKRLWYTDAINTDFVIDFIPGYENLLAATGGTSHGFKFLPVLGEFVVNKLRDETNEYTHHFRWKDVEEMDYDDYGLTVDLSKESERVFDKAVLSKDEDLEFSKDDLDMLDSVVL